MVSQTLQVRMNKTLVKQVDAFVKSGLYDNRSEVIRDAVRQITAPRLKPEVLAECERIEAEMDAGKETPLEAVKKKLLN